MKGSKMNMEIFDDEISGDVNLKFNYLSIPVMVKYSLGGLNLQAGPSFDFLMSAKTDFDGDEEDIKDEFKGMDLGLGFGLGYDFPGGLSIDGRYVIGLSDINKSEDLEGIEIKNNCLMFTLGYSF